MNYLENLINKSHKIYIKDIKIHPYLIMFNIGFFVSIIFTYIYSKIFDNIDFYKFSISILFVFLTYELIFLKIKKNILKTRSRSYLQDLFFLIPFEILLIYIFNLNITGSLDLIGLILPILISFTRIGCFLGGCCYGKISKYGIIYPENIFHNYKIWFQNYTPGPFTNKRVFPIQLIESLFNLIVFFILFLIVLNDINGIILPLYLFLYSAYRFCADFFRPVSQRPRYLIFSEAQIFSIVILSLSACWILLFYKF